MKTRTTTLAAVVLFTVAGCAQMSPLSSIGEPEQRMPARQEVIAPLPSNPLIRSNYEAADALIRKAAPELLRDVPLLMSTVVDIDDLEASSTLGRLISENVSARFTSSGFRMVELKFQNAVYMKRNEGELMLTRQIRDVATAHNAQAVIVGTFSKGVDQVFINLKLVTPDDNIVLSAHDYALRIDNDVKELIYNRVFRRR